jgi:hypothetical protein
MSRRDDVIDADRPAGKGAPFRVSWGALFAGSVAALGIWILLLAFGVALGLSTIDPDDAGTLRASSIFTGVWGLASPLLALFIGGLVAGRSAGVLGRGGGAIHGMVVWSLTALGGVWVVANLFGGVLGSAVAVGKNVATQAIVDKTAPPAEKAEGVVGDVQAAIGKVGDKAAANLKEDAIEAAPETGTAFWVVFGALLLGLFAAMGGGAAGITREQRRTAEAEVAVASVVAADPAIGVPAPIAASEPEVQELRAEIAQLRSEIREALIARGELHHH